MNGKNVTVEKEEQSSNHRNTRRRAKGVGENGWQKNFPNLWKEVPTQIQEAQIVPNKINSNKATPRRIVIKIIKLKDKDRLHKERKKIKTKQNNL